MATQSSSGRDDLLGQRKEAAGGYPERQPDMRERASGAADKAREQADAGLDKAADKMSSASDRIREKSQQQGGMQAQAGTKIAEGLDKTSDYLQSHDTNEILDDVEHYVREHPLQAVAGAVVGGFVIARILR
jgi:ElaB/YqjD/DUF883 family membrane-anchored ribosome-binding protein